jgi:hypothetical protein
VDHRVIAHQRVVRWSEPFEAGQAADEEWDDILAGAELEI